MAFAKQRADDIDWDATIELDNEQLGLMSNDGTLFRGQPFRMHICQNLGTYMLSVPENGLRIPKVTEGWIGNTTWKDPAPLVLGTLTGTSKPKFRQGAGTKAASWASVANSFQYPSSIRPSNSAGTSSGFMQREAKSCRPSAMDRCSPARGSSNERNRTI